MKIYHSNCRVDGAVTPIPVASHSNGHLIVQDTWRASGLDCIAYEGISHRSRTSIRPRGAAAIEGRTAITTLVGNSLLIMKENNVSEEVCRLPVIFQFIH